MKQTQEFERRLQALFADSLTCAVSAYTQFTFDHLAGTNVDLLDRLHPHGDFWNRLMGGLQTSAFAALGRIYETKSDTYNALELIRFADKHPGIFGSAALEARKVAAGVMPSAAKRYAQEAFKLPRRGGLSRLRTALDEKRRFYQKKVAPIRYQVFAHAGKLDRDDRHRLFTHLGMRELEDLVVFPLRLHRALFDLYQNGREPRLDVVPSHTLDVVKAIPADGVSTWEHLHAAKDTREFLTWLGTAPIASDGG